MSGYNRQPPFDLSPIVAPVHEQTHPMPESACDEPLYVLAGGRSARFGVDKASHPVRGRAWIVHVVESLGRSADEATQVGGAIRLVGRRIEDHPATPGPVGGLLAALLDRRQRFGDGPLVLASCDLVDPLQNWLTPLRECLTDDRRSASAYRREGLWSPFPSLWDSRCYESLEQHTRSGAQSLQRALEVAGAASLEWPHDGSGPPQANTPEELEALLARTPAQGAGA